MRVKHWLIGCAICFAGIGGAAATSVDNRELDNSQRSNGDASISRDSGNSNEAGTGGEPGLAHDSAPRSAGNESHKSASGSIPDHSAGDVTPPARAQQTHLGWQSLLPGSIQ